jgi:hypothetical protein
VTLAVALAALKLRLSGNSELCQNARRPHAAAVAEGAMGGSGNLSLSDDGGQSDSEPLSQASTDQQILTPSRKAKAAERGA